MLKRWILAAILAVLLGALLDHEDAFEDRPSLHFKPVPGRTAKPPRIPWP
jgi:hypothetical protein